MKKNSSFIYFFLLVVLTGLSCNTTYQSQALQYKTYRISDTQRKDSSVLSFLKPYSDNVNKTMNDVVGIADISLDKKQPESTLGNFMVDAFLSMAADKYNTKVDVAFLNTAKIKRRCAATIFGFNSCQRGISNGGPYDADKRQESRKCNDWRKAA